MTTMERAILLSVLTLGVAIASGLEPIKVNMDSAAFCGKVQEPAFTQNVHLTSTGMSPNNFCSVGVYSGQKPSGCKFSALCVKITHSKVSDCSMKVTFTGKMFDGTMDQWRELSCSQPFAVDHEWCAPAEFLVTDISGKKLTSNNGKHDFAFNATVFSKCTDKPLEKIPLNPDDDFKNPDQDEADHQNRILGVIVGVCLASIFLIILFFTYCFYKNKAYSEPKSESRERLPEVGLSTKYKPAPKPVVEPTKFTQSIDIRL